jgi:Domain of unknown function (DUF6458)
MRPPFDCTTRIPGTLEAMTIGSSLFLIALGAILKYAVTADLAGVDLQVVGVILIVVGLVGLVIGLMMYVAGRDRWHRDVPPDPY